jgi:hypothetical protein
VKLTRLSQLVRRELAASLRRPGTWLLFTGFLLAIGLFYLLRLAAGEGGDHGGFLREVGAVLLPVGCLYGAACLGDRERLRLYLRSPFAPLELTLGLLAPGIFWAVALGLSGGFLPLLTFADAPVDLEFLLAGGGALVLLGVAVVSLGAGATALLDHLGAGALLAFLVSLALWGAGGLASATGFSFLAKLDLGAGLLAAGQGWFSLTASSPALVVALLGLWLTREALEARRW